MVNRHMANRETPCAICQGVFLFASGSRLPVKEKSKHQYQQAVWGETSSKSPPNIEFDWRNLSTSHSIVMSVCTFSAKLAQERSVSKHDGLNWHADK
jgi:hypothetical protein